MCATWVSVFFQQNSVLILSFLSLVQQGNGAEGGPDLSQWILTWCVGLHRKLQWMLRKKRSTTTKRSNDIPALQKKHLPSPHVFFFLIYFWNCPLKKKKKKERKKDEWWRILNTRHSLFWLKPLYPALIYRALCIALTISPFPVPWTCHFLNNYWRICTF